MDDVPLMHVGQRCNHLLGGGNDSQHVWLPRKGHVLAETAPLNGILRDNTFCSVALLPCIQ